MMFKKIYQKKELILLLILLVHLGWRIFGYHQNYLQPFDPGHWQDRYLKSQWARPDPVESLGDDGLYTYAGWEYLQGVDPTSINPEMPPLGKYFLGLTILIFNNQNVFALLTSLSTLFIFFQLNKLIFKDQFLALIPVAFFSFEPLFWQQLRAPYLDLLYLFFLLATFYFFLKKQFFLSSTLWGCFLNTKSTHSSLFLLGALFLVYFLIKKDWPAFKKWLISLIMIPAVTFLVYFRYFQLGHSLKDFLTLQKWVFNFYRQGAKGQFGAVWSILLFGQWQTWWQEEKIAINEWQLSWSLITAAFLYSLFTVRKIFKNRLFLVWLWSLIYLFFLNFIPVWPRYLLILFPFGYNLLVWHGQSLLKKSS